MRAGALRFAFAALSVLAAACTIVHSFDGFSDEFGKSDASFVDGEPPADGDVLDGGGVDGDADGATPPRPKVTCSVTTLASFGGADPKTPEYLSVLAVGDRTLTLAGGNQDPDAGFNRDAGLILRMDKQPSTPTRVDDGLPVVRGCVAHPEGAVCGIGSRLWLYVADGGVRAMLDTRESVIDLTPASGGVLTATRTASSGAVWYTPFADEDASVRRTLEGAVRIRIDDDAGVVVVGRSDPLLSVYRRSEWDLVDAGDAAADGCAIVKDTANTQLAVGKRGVYWLTKGTSNLRRADPSCAAATDEVIDIFYGLAADDRFVFVQRSNDVQLRWADDIAREACTVPLDAGIKAIPGSQTAMFDGDDVYFLSPPRILKLHFVMEP